MGIKPKSEEEAISIIIDYIILYINEIKKLEPVLNGFDMLKSFNKIQLKLEERRSEFPEEIGVDEAMRYLASGFKTTSDIFQRKEELR